jgi:site-specific recombinase XerD
VFIGTKLGGKLTGKPLTRRDVGRILKSLAKRAKLAGADAFSAHSLRVGMCQDLIADGASTAAVMDAGGWSSEVMIARYNRRHKAKTGAVAKYHEKKRFR